MKYTFKDVEPKLKCLYEKYVWGEITNETKSALLEEFSDDFRQAKLWPKGLEQISKSENIKYVNDDFSGDYKTSIMNLINYLIYFAYIKNYDYLNTTDFELKKFIELVCRIMNTIHLKSTLSSTILYKALTKHNELIRLYNYIHVETADNIEFNNMDLRTYYYATLEELVKNNKISYAIDFHKQNKSYFSNDALFKILVKNLDDKKIELIDKKDLTYINSEFDKVYFWNRNIKTEEENEKNNKRDLFDVEGLYDCDLYRSKREDLIFCFIEYLEYFYDDYKNKKNKLITPNIPHLYKCVDDIINKGSYYIGQKKYDVVGYSYLEKFNRFLKERLELTHCRNEKLSDEEIKNIVKDDDLEYSNEEILSEILNQVDSRHHKSEILWEYRIKTLSYQSLDASDLDCIKIPIDGATSGDKQHYICCHHNLANISNYFLEYLYLILVVSNNIFNDSKLRKELDKNKKLNKFIRGIFDLYLNIQDWNSSVLSYTEKNQEFIDKLNKRSEYLDELYVSDIIEKQFKNSSSQEVIDDNVKQYFSGNNFKNNSFNEKQINLLLDKIKKESSIKQIISTNQIMFSPFKELDSSLCYGDYTSMVVCEIKSLERYLKDTIIYVAKKNNKNILEERKKVDGKPVGRSKYKFVDKNYRWDNTKFACKKVEVDDSTNYMNLSNSKDNNSIAIEIGTCLTIIKENNSYFINTGYNNSSFHFNNDIQTCPIYRDWVMKVRNQYMHVKEINTLEEAKEISRLTAYWLLKAIDELIKIE